MNKLSLLAVLLPFFISGCTTIYYPRTISSSSAIEQALRDQTAKKSCEKIFYNRNFLRLQERISEYEYDLKNWRRGDSNKILREKIKNLQKEAINTNIFDEIIKTIEGKKVYFDIRGPYGDNYLVRTYIERILRNTNVISISKEQNPDIRFVVTIKQDGITQNFYHFLFLYFKFKLDATMDIDVEVFDFNTGKLLYQSTDLRVVAFHQSVYVLGFGPINETSLEK